MSSLRRYTWVSCAAATVLASVALVIPASAATAPATVRATAPAAGDTWPTFGHDSRHSEVSPDTAIGASTAPSLVKRWSTRLASTKDQPSPAVAYDVSLKQTLVYDVTYTGIASAFNASTGALVWQRNIGATVDSSPAVYGNTVYFGDNSGTLEALNATTGAVQCTFTLPVTQPVQIISAPVVGNVDGSGPTVFIGDAGILSSTEAQNGGHFWAITGVGNTAGECQLKWSYNNWLKKGTNGTMTGVWDEPALTRNSAGTWAVVFGTSNPDDAVYALNAATGARLWRFQTQQTGNDQDVGAGPTISPPGRNGFADGVVYIDGKDGIEYALDLLTGKEIWSFTLGTGSSSALAVSVAALTGDTLAVGFAGSVFALNATTGAVLWQATLGGTVQASPAVSGGAGNQVLFVGDLNDLEYGLSLSTGAVIFTATTSGRILASTAVATGMLYFASGGTLYAYAPA